jgi:hypothetical protein
MLKYADYVKNNIQSTDMFVPVCCKLYIYYFLRLYNEFFIILYNILIIAELDCCKIIILSIYVPSTHAYTHILCLSLDLPYETRLHYDH